jgi:hypothetical protein
MFFTSFALINEKMKKKEKKILKYNSAHVDFNHSLSIYNAIALPIQLPFADFCSQNCF